jgi:hypothetical protein
VRFPVRSGCLADEAKTSTKRRRSEMQQVIAVQDYWRFRIEGWCYDLEDGEHPYEHATLLAVPFLLFEATDGASPFIVPIDVEHIADGCVVEGKDDVNGWTRRFPGGAKDALAYAGRLDNCTQCPRKDLGILDWDESTVHVRLEHDHDCPDWLATLARRRPAQSSATVPTTATPRRKRKRKAPAARGSRP